MSTDDQKPASDVDTLRALLLGSDDASLRSIEALAERVGSVESALADDPVTAARVQALLAEVLDGLQGDERRLVQERLTALLLANIQNEIKAARPSFIEAIYPVAGGLVRKGITQAIAELLELIEERLSQPVTFYKRAQIRFQSLVTGKPEAEIWLRQTGLFHVDRILLVDRSSGTVITGLRQERDGTATDTSQSSGTVQGEDQIVSGMLTAIMSFSQEAFGDGGGGELSTLEFENSQLHLKATPMVLMVVRTIGAPPAKLDGIIENRFDRIVTDNADALSSFDGSLPDDSRLKIQSQLRRLLRELRKAESEGRGAPVRPGNRWRTFTTFIVALGFVLLMALGLIALVNVVRISSNVNRVEDTIATVEALQAYPIEASYDQSKASVVVSGLVPDAAAAGLLENRLRQAHPRLALSFALSNIATDAVRPNLRGPRIEREANSTGVNQLRDEAFIRDTIILDLEQQISDLRGTLEGREAVAAAASYPSLTYDLDPSLSTLRDQVGRELMARLENVAMSANGGETADDFGALLGLDGAGASSADRLDEETIAGTLIGFTAAGNFTDIRFAVEAARLVAETTRGKPDGARLEVLSISRPVIGRPAPESMEHFIASKARALVVAQGIDPAMVVIRNGGDAAPVAEIDPKSWRKSHYVGFRLAY